MDKLLNGFCQHGRAPDSCMECNPRLPRLTEVRICDECVNVGNCSVTMIRCKGFIPIKDANKAVAPDAERG